MAVELGDVMAAAAEAAAAASRHVRVRAAYVFGSHVDGTAGEYSDIDLAVFIEGAEDWSLDQRVHLAVLVGREVGDDVEMHFFCAAAFENSEPASFATYVKKHGVRVPIDE